MKTSDFDNFQQFYYVQFGLQQKQKKTNHIAYLPEVSINILHWRVWLIEICNIDILLAQKYHLILYRCWRPMKLWETITSDAKKFQRRLVKALKNEDGTMSGTMSPSDKVFYSQFPDKPIFLPH